MQTAKLESFPPVPWEILTNLLNSDDNTFDDEESEWRGYPCGAVAGGMR